MTRLTLLLSVLLSMPLRPQARPDTLYRVEVSASIAGMVSFFRNERFQNAEGYSKPGYGGFVHVMWHPARLLSIGVLSGYLFLSRDEIALPNKPGESAYARLRAVPLQVAIAMQEHNFEWGLGMGSYLLLSQIEYGTSASSWRSELGITFFARQQYQLTEQMFLGPELKVLYLGYRGILSVIPSVTLHWQSKGY